MTNYVYDGLNPVQEKAGATVTANLLTGLGIDEFFTRTDGVGVRSLLPEALGSTVALGDSTGTLQTQYTYEPFGYTTQTGQANTNYYKYTGREDDGSGLYYYRGRYYHPRLQRFLAEDPIGFAGGDPNIYAYVKGNPISKRDPRGLETAQVGLSMGFTLPNGFAVNGFAGFTCDDQGNCGVYWGGGPGAGIGAGALGGVSVGVSTAKTICDLRGPFENVNMGGGWGPSATGDGFWGSSDNGLVLGGGVTVGLGLGGTSFAGVTNTWVIPLFKWSNYGK